MSDTAPQYPEPSDFQKIIDQTARSAVDQAYRTLTEHADPAVREWAAEFDIQGARPTFAPVIEHYSKAYFREFYKIGFQQGALAKLASTGGLGERSIVTRHTPDGRIAEVVKIPLSVAERQALEAQQGTAA